MNINCDEKSQQFDIVWLIRYFWAKRWLIAKVTAILLALGMVKYFVSPKKFTASASLIAVEDGNMSVGLGSLASIAGINIGNGEVGSMIITRELFPKVTKSTPFLMKIMDVKVPWMKPDTVMSTYEYIVADTVMDFGKLLYKYTVGLPGVIITAIKGKNQSVSVGEDAPYMSLTEKQRDAIESLKDRIIVDEDEQYGTIEISVVSESALQSAVLASAVIDSLQETVTEYKTRRAKKIYDFLLERYLDAQNEYETNRKKLMGYRDSHRNMVLERVDYEYQKLSDQYDLSYSILKSLSQQIEKSKIEVMEDTPIFSVVEPVVVPDKKSSPKLLLHIIGSVFLGMFLSIGWLLMRLAWFQFFEPEKYTALLEEYKTL